MIRCLHCHAETSNGLALCELCQRFATSALEYLPIYFRNLARWRPGRAGSRPVPGSRVLYDGGQRDAGTGDRISDRLDEAGNALTTWARAFADDRPHFTRPLTLRDAVLSGDLSEEVADDTALVIATLCAAFADRLPSVATLGWAGDFVRDLAHHEEVLRALTPLVPGWYAGPCDRCRTPVHVTPGTTWITCEGCGATSHAGDHREVIIAEARGWIARPKPMAEAIVALVDTEDSAAKVYARIRQWAKRGDLEAHHQLVRDYRWDDDLDRFVVDDVETGHARYRLGDVLALVLRDTRSVVHADAS